MFGKVKEYKLLSVMIGLVMVVSLFAGAAMAGEENDIEFKQITRLAGENRYATAVEIAEYAYDGQEVETVILARGDELYDALAGSVLAEAIGAPILLTDSEELREETSQAIEDFGATKAIILGGEAAVSTAAKDALTSDDLNLEVERIYGKNRYETAAKIAERVAEELGEQFPEEAFIVSGNAPPDALTIGSNAAENGMPILLVQEDEVPEATQKIIDGLGINELTIIGGNAVVTDGVQNELDAERIYGANRFKTSAEVAEAYYSAPDNIPDSVIFAGGANENLVDAMAGGYFGAQLGAPILYTSSLDDDIKDYLATVVFPDTTAYILGGYAAVSQEAEEEIEAIFEDPLDPIVDPIDPPDPEIDEIDVNNDVEDITVPFGTSEADAIAILVEEITISDTDEETYVVSLDWSIADYDGDSAGDYDATGTFELPEGVAQTDPETDLEVEATVTVEEEEPIEPDPLEVVSVEAITDTVTVPYGTTEAEAIEALDDEVEFEGVVEDEDNVTLDVVDWTAVGEYVGDTAGDYTFEGEAQLPENNYVWGEDVETTVTATVTVLEEPTYEVTFTVTDEDEGAIEGATVNLDGDEVDTDEAGEAVFENLVAGTYEYSVSKDGYLTEDGELEVVDDDVDEEVTLVEAFTLSIEVEPENSGSVTGSGEYAAGEEVSITADPADDYVFFGWSAEINGFADAEAASTIFTMPAEAATITAYFAPKVPQKPVYNVDKNEGYVNISDAVSNADPNNKILVKAGNYEELVTIGVEGLTLKSVVEHGAVIDGDFKDIGDYKGQIHINADDVTVSGFKIQDAFNGIFVSNAQNTVVENNQIVDTALRSLTFHHGKSHKVNNNIIENQGSWGNERQPRGLFLYHAEEVTATNNQLINAGLSFADIIDDLDVLETHDIDDSNTVNDKPLIYWTNKSGETVPEDAGAVFLFGCDDMTVENLDIESTETAVYIAYGEGNNVISNNTIGGGEPILSRSGGEWNIGWRGIIVRSTNNSNEIHDNTVINARGGIETRFADDNEISNNTINEARESIVVYGSDNTEATGNHLTNAYRDGFTIWGDSDNTVIENNYIADNATTGSNWAGIRQFGNADGTVARNNKILGNSMEKGFGALANNGEIDARENWWGHESGPTHSSNPDGVGDKVSDNVLFCPWYEDEEMTTTAWITATVNNADELQAALDNECVGTIILDEEIEVEDGDTLELDSDNEVTITGDGEFTGEGVVDVVTARIVFYDFMYDVDDDVVYNFNIAGGFSGGYAQNSIDGNQGMLRVHTDAGEDYSDLTDVVVDFVDTDADPYMTLAVTVEEDTTIKDGDDEDQIIPEGRESLVLLSNRYTGNWYIMGITEANRFGNLEDLISSISDAENEDFTVDGINVFGVEAQAQAKIEAITVHGDEETTIFERK